MPKFRKKPVVIEARQWFGGAPNAGPIIDWILSEGERAARWDDPETESGAGVIQIDTLEGTMLASPGDWIIKGVSGEFYPCKPDIFEQTYEAVDG
jgi:hypothetical protein